MPEATIDAVLGSNDNVSDALTDTAAEAEETFSAISQAGIDFEDVFAVLEQEGVDKFVAAWNELLDSMQARLS